MRKKFVRTNSWRLSQWVLIGLTLGVTFCVVCVAVGWLLAANVFKSPSSSAASDIAADLPRSDSAFNVGTRIGQPAPAFTLPDAQGQPYNFHPGDGRKYLVAFNMGSA